MASTYFPSVASLPAKPRHKGEDRLRWGRLGAFSSIMLPISAAQVPLGVFLPAIYAQHFGLPLGILGVIFLTERIWGSFSDPLIGALSDRTRSRFGRRKPWIFAGATLFAAATILLFFPFVKPTPLYLGVGLFTFYLAWSMIYIPYLAWSGELSGEYHGRTRIATYQSVAAAVSLMLVLALPTLADQLRPHDAALKLALMGGIILLALPVTVTLTLRSFDEPAAPPARQEKIPLLAATRLILREGPLVRVLLSDFAVTIGQFIRGTLIVFYVTAYAGLPQWSSGLFLVQFVFGVLAGPLWASIARRYGKHQTAIAAELIQVAINLGLLLVLPKQLPLLLALTIAQGFAQGSGNLMLRSMVADVADRHRLETGADRTALFFSVFSLSMKAGTAVAVGIALPLVGWLGFDPVAKVNPPHALAALAYVFALGPAIAHIVSAALLTGFPIDEARHGEIRRALAERDACEIL